MMFNSHFSCKSNLHFKRERASFDACYSALLLPAAAFCRREHKSSPLAPQPANYQGIAYFLSHSAPTN